MPLVAYYTACAFLCVYILLASIEFGSSLFMLSDSVLEGRVVKTYMHPIWETTNIFLVFFLIILFTCFPKALPDFSTALFPILSIALIFFVLRVIGILGLFYRESTSRLWQLCFVLGSIGAPVCLSAFYYFVLTGQTPSWPLPSLELALLAVILTTILFISSSFFLYFTRREAPLRWLKLVAIISGFVWYVAITWLVAVLPSNTFLTHASISLMCCIGAVLLGLLLIFFYLLEKGLFLSAFALVALQFCVYFFYLTVVQTPYLIYPTITLAGSFTSIALFNAIFISGCVGMVFLIPALVLLYRLFSFTERGRDM